MRWNEIINEGSDYHCPECGDYLGKASEVIANDAEYCGQCGWEPKRRSSRSSRFEDLNEELIERQIFGQNIPDWEVEADQDYGAAFNNEPYYAPALVHYERGKFYVAISSEQIEVFTTSEQVEQFLIKYGYTEYDGWDDWRPRTPLGVD